VTGTDNRQPTTGNPHQYKISGHLVTLPPCHPVTVVIGYGNDLRGDDAVGPLAARAIAKWDAPGVWALAVHQLTPELAEALAAADLAIFVDACLPAPTSSGTEECEAGAIAVEPLAAATRDTPSGHASDPRALLALAEALYGRHPAAWSIGVPAHNFELGAALSPQAERGLAAALQQVRDLI
jgi:hydrogenase maturation protease